LQDETDLGIAGTYTLWAKIVDLQSKVSIGSPITILVKNKGE
jgi:hypothetical protein